MKKITKEEYKAIEVRPNRKASPHGAKARELIIQFMESDDEIVEIEPSDFDDAFDFNDMKQRNKAAGYLRNKLNTNEFKDEQLIAKTKGGKIFLGYKDTMGELAWWEKSRNQK